MSRILQQAHRIFRKLAQEVSQDPKIAHSYVVTTDKTSPRMVAYRYD